MEFQCVDMHIDQSAFASREAAAEAAGVASIEGWLGWTKILEKIATGKDYAELYEGGEVHAGQRRLTYTFGATIPIQWESTEAAKAEKYTGLFLSGGDYGFLRLSALRTLREMIGHEPFELTAAIKLFRKGMKSGNLWFGPMDPDHQLNTKDILTTHPKTRQKGILFDLFVASLHRAADYASFSGCSDFGHFDQDGNNAVNVRVPFEAILLPSPAFYQAIETRSQDPSTFVESLLRLRFNPGVTLFDVFALSVPGQMSNSTLCFNGLGSTLNIEALSSDECEWKIIGKIVAKGPSRLSRYGDERMRFSRTRFTEDLNLPSSEAWRAFLESKRSIISPYPYLPMRFLQRIITASWILAEYAVSILVWLGEFYGLIETKPSSIEDCPYYQAINYFNGDSETSSEESSSDNNANSDTAGMPPSHPHAGDGLTEEDCPYMQAMKKRLEEEELTRSSSRE